MLKRGTVDKKIQLGKEQDLFLVSSKKMKKRIKEKKIHKL